MVAPRTKPNPAPNTRPPSTSRKNTVSSPAVPAPSGRSAAPTADSTPSIASALTSSPPSPISNSTTAISSGSSSPKTSGASVPCASAAPGSTSSGQPNASTPATETRATATVERGRSAIARTTEGGSTAVGVGRWWRSRRTVRERLPHVVDGEPAAGSGHLRHLRCERGGGDHDLGRSGRRPPPRRRPSPPRGRRRRPRTRRRAWRAGPSGPAARGREPPLAERVWRCSRALAWARRAAARAGRR